MPPHVAATTESNKHNAESELNAVQDATNTSPTWQQSPSVAHSTAIDEDIELEQLTGTETNVAMREDVPPDGGYGSTRTIHSERNYS